MQTGAIAADSETHPQLVTALHACDTATDDALVLAIARGADHVAVVPCCQAEVARQLERADARRSGGRGAVRASAAPARARLAPDQRRPRTRARSARLQGDRDRARWLGAFGQERADPRQARASLRRRRARAAPRRARAVRDRARGRARARRARPRSTRPVGSGRRLEHERDDRRSTTTSSSCGPAWARYRPNTGTSRTSSPSAHGADASSSRSSPSLLDRDAMRLAAREWIPRGDHARGRRNRAATARRRMPRASREQTSAWPRPWQAARQREPREFMRASCPVRPDLGHAAGRRTRVRCAMLELRDGPDVDLDGSPCCARAARLPRSHAQRWRNSSPVRAGSCTRTTTASSSASRARFPTA